MLSASRWLGAYAIVCLTVSSMWSQLGMASPFWLILLALCTSPWILTSKMQSDWSWRVPKPTVLQIGLGLAISLPAGIYLALTARQEFPFAGDQDHHWLMGQSLLHELNWTLLFSLLIAGAALFFIQKSRWIALLWLTAALVVSHFFQPTEYVLRYPAGFYFFAAPMNLLFHTATDPLFAQRLTNWLSLPVYLLFLRPWLVRRWPDLKAAIFAAFFLWQKDWIYYSASTYIEPWSLVFTLLAIELALSKEERDIELAPALAGFGCMFKEQAVFALVFSGFVFWQHKRRTWGWWQATLSGLAYILPFFIYYSARSRAGVFRKVETSNWFDLLNLDRWEDYALHFHASQGIGGELALGILLFLILLALTKSRIRLPLYLSLLLFLATEVMYFTDKLSAEYLAYPRFHILTWPLAAVAVLLVYDSLSKQLKSLLTGLVVLAAGLNLWAAEPLFALGLRPDIERNFFEQYYAPNYFPIRQLLAFLPAASYLQPRELILYVPVDYGSFPYSVGKVYARDMDAKVMKRTWVKSLLCRCDTPYVVSLLIDLYRPPGDFIVGHPSNLGPEDLKKCAEELRHSCAKVETVSGPDGRLIGAIGYTP